MNRSIRAVVIAGGLFAAGDCAATAQRTFVASTGSDSASCLINAPCRGFATAISQTSVGGEIIVVDSAGYGSVTITKAVSIIAPAGVYAGISVFPGNDGVTVNAPGATVVLRGLSINGQGGGTGINVQNAARVRIEGCVVSNMAQDGIYHVASGAAVVVLDTIVRDNANFGINIIANTSVVLDRVRVEHNGGSGLGIVPASAAGSSATITDSLFAHNLAHGIVADAPNGAITRVQVDRSNLSDNAGSGFLGTTVHAGANVRASFVRNDIHGNGVDGVTLSGANGFVAMYATDNAVQGNAVFGMHASGSAELDVASNTAHRNGNLALWCDNGASIPTLGNNMTDGIGGDRICWATRFGD